MSFIHPLVKLQKRQPPFAIQSELSTKSTAFAPHLGPNCCDLIEKPRLALIKSVDPDVPVIHHGMNLTFTLELKNTGIIPIYNITVVDKLDILYEYLADSQEGCDQMDDSDPTGKGLIWFVGFLNKGESLFLKFKVRPFDVDMPQTVTNIAYANSEETGEVPSNRIDKLIIVAKREFVITKSVEPLTILEYGDVVKYTIEVVNIGWVDANFVKITDAVPTELTYVPGSIAGAEARDDTAPVDPGLVWTVQKLPKMERVEVSYSATTNHVRVPTTFINTAHVEAVKYPLTTSNEVVSQIVPPVPDLSIVKAIHYHDSERTVKRYVEFDEACDFELTVTNHSPFPAYDIRVTDRVQTPWIYTANTIEGGDERDDADPYGTGLVWRVAVLDPGATISLRFGVVMGEVLVETIAKNYATLDAENMPSEDSNEVVVQVKPPIPQLILLKTVVPDIHQVQYGETRTFHLNVTNTGKTVARNIIITDIVKEPWFYTVGTMTGGDMRDDSDPTGSGLQWQLRELVPSETHVFTFDVTAGEVHVPTLAENSFVLEADNKVPEESNKTENEIVPAVPQLTIIKTIDPDTPTAEYGESRTFHITVTNTGPTSAINVRVVDKVMFPWVYTPSSIVGGETQEEYVVDGIQHLKWTVAQMTPGESQVFSFAVTAGEVHEPTIARNGAVLSADNKEDEDSNETETTILPAKPQLSILKSIEPNLPTAEYGDSRKFNITVTNNGATIAKNLTVTDVVHFPWIYTAGTISGGDTRDDSDPANRGLMWTLGELQPGSQHVFSFSVTAGEVEDETLAVNSAILDADNKEPEESNKIEIPILPPTPDLTIVKTIEPTTEPVYGGDERQFILTITNNGVTNAHEIKVVDKVQHPWTYIAGSISGGDTRVDSDPIGAGLQWFINTMVPQQTVVLSFRVVAELVEVDTIAKNIAIISSKNKPEEESNENEVIVKPLTPTLTLQKSINPETDPVGFAERRTFTLTAANVGVNAATNVQIADTVQWPWQYVGGSIAGGDTNSEASQPALTWQFASIQAGESRSVSFDVRALEVNEATQAVNFATIDADHMDAFESNEIIRNILPPVVNVSIQKSISPTTDPVPSGESRVFTLNVQNHGVTAVSAITVTDLVRHPWTYQSGSMSGGSSRDDTSPTGTGLRWTIDTLNPSQTVALTFTVMAADVTVSTQVINFATMTSPDFDQVQSNTVVNNIVPSVPSLTLALTSNPASSSIPYCTHMEYILTARNTGSVTATNVRVTNLVSNNYSYTNNSMTGGDSRNQSTPYSGSGLVWTVNSIAPGASVPLTFKIHPKNINNYRPYSVSNQGRLTADKFSQITSNTDTKNIQAADFFAVWTSPTTFTISGDGVTKVNGSMTYYVNPTYIFEHGGFIVQQPYYPGNPPPPMNPVFGGFDVMNPNDVAPPLHDQRAWSLLGVFYQKAQPQSLTCSINTITYTFSSPVKNLFVAVNELDQGALRFKSATNASGGTIAGTTLANKITIQAGSVNFRNKSGKQSDGTYLINYPAAGNGSDISGVVTIAEEIKTLTLEYTAPYMTWQRDYFAITFALFCPITSSFIDVGTL